MKRTLWCERAWLGDASPQTSVLLHIDGERITTVTTGVPAPAGAEILVGLTLPGFANAHSHAFHRKLRGRTQDASGSFWTWREEMYRVAATLDPDSYETLATAAFREMVMSGYTAVGEFHYLHHGPNGKPYDDPNAMSEALVSAAATAGIRLTLIDALYLHGGLEGRYLPLDPVQRRFSDGSASAWADRVAGWSTIARKGVAVHSVRAVDPEAMRVARQVADDLGSPVHAHVSEQPAENEACLAFHGCTPVELLADAGLIDGNSTAVHATHLTDGDRRILGRAESTVCLCITTERDLADGIGPSLELVAEGARLAIGSDSHAVIDPFEETRAIELETRMTTLTRGNHSVPALLAAGTRNGYAAIGWPEGGVIAAGRLADLITIEFESPRLRDIPAEHLMAGVVFAASPEDITSVVVGGRTVHRR